MQGLRPLLRSVNLFQQIICSLVYFLRGKYLCVCDSVYSIGDQNFSIYHVNGNKNMTIKFIISCDISQSHNHFFISVLIFHCGQMDGWMYGYEYIYYAYLGLYFMGLLPFFPLRVNGFLSVVVMLLRFSFMDLGLELSWEIKICALYRTSSTYGQSVDRQYFLCLIIGMS